MPVGTLNVAVTAETRKARESLESLRHSVTGLGSDVASANANFQGMSTREFENKFAPPKIKENAKDFATATDLMRVSVVNLSAEADRYKGLEKQLAKDIPLLKQMKSGLSQVKVGIAGLLVVPMVFKWGLQFGKAIKENVSYIHSWKDAMQQAGAVFDLNESIQEELTRKTEEANAALKAQNDLLAQQAQEARRVQASFKERFIGGRMDIDQAQGVKVDRQFPTDVSQFGMDRAIQLANQRQRAEELSAEREAQRLATEEKIAAMNEQNRKAQDAAEQRRVEMQQQIQSIEELRIRVQEQGLDASERERNSFMRTLTDPALRQQALDLFGQLEQQDGGKRGGLAGSQSLAAQDPLSREGYGQRVRSLAQTDIGKVGQQQLAVQKKMQAGIERIAERPPVVLAAANL